MWTLFSGDDGSTMNNIVEGFNQSQSEYHLTHIIIDYQNLLTKLALASGDDAASPHLFVSYASDIAYFVELNRIQPIEETLASYPEFDFSLDRYNPACKILNVYNGTRYAVTLDFPSVGTYANLDLVAQYCPEVLADNVLTWDEIKEVGKSLQDQGIEDVKVLTSEWAMNDIIQTYMLYDTSWATDDAQELALDRDAMINTVNTWKECYDAGYLWQDGDDCPGMFAQGESIFFTGGNWCMNAVKNYGFDFSFLAAPQLAADNVIVYGDAHSFMLPQRGYTDAERKGIASWIAYFYDHSLEWAQAGSLIAANGPRQSEEFEQLPQAFVADNYEPFTPPYRYTAILTGVIDSLGWQPVYGYMSADDYVDTLIKQISEKIAAQ
ncbi:MAG: extracellular solute-binding protein [Eubacteriales bacterium]|nr:extracellular solute-binding protein [Eubacteriales bacterium]